MGADVAYVSADGRYLIAGDLYEIDTRTNMTEQGRAAARIKLLAKLDERDMIVFSPQGREAHHHGVHRRRVRLLPQAPRPDRPAHQARREGALRGLSARRAGHRRLAKMEAVWCSKDRQSAITQAKLGQIVQVAELRRDAGRQAVQARRRPRCARHAGDLHDAAASTSAATCRPADLVKQLEESEAKQKKGS